jgi:hypothetical protein
MFRALFSRSSSAVSVPGRATRARGAETRPPQAFAHRAWSTRLGDWLGASGWRVAGAELPSSFGRRSRLDALAAARLDFADALDDVHTPAVAFALDRIAVTRSLHELWHFRGEVFGHVARRHDQTEAARRLAMLDRHFTKRSALARWRDASDAGADADSAGR